MKKIKLITSLAALATIGTSIGVLASCSCNDGDKTIDVVIEGGGSYDKIKSKIALNQDSIIYLTPDESKVFKDLKEVKVGGKTLTIIEDYKFEQKTNGTDYILTIYAKAMTSPKIVIEIEYEDKKPTGIVLSETSKTIEHTKSFTIHASYKYASNDETVNWAVTTGNDVIHLSSATSILEQDITVFTYKTGSAVITATLGEYTATCSVTVTDHIPVLESISIKTPASKTTFNVNDTFSSAGLKLIAKYDTKEEEVTTGFTTDYDGYKFTAEDVGTGKKVTVTYSTQTTSYTIDVQAKVINKIKVEGIQNIDVDDTKTLKYIAKDQDDDDITEKCVFTIEDKDAPGKSIGTFTDNVLTLTEKSKNCSAKITAKLKDTNAELVPLEVETGSFSKLDPDKLQIHEVKTLNTAEGTVIIPSRYFYQQGTIITSSNITNIIEAKQDGITEIYIPKTISDISAKPFGKGLKIIKLNGANTTYTCSNNCLIKSVDGVKTLMFGCIGTKIPIDASVVTAIASNAFYNTGITSVTIPNNITYIGMGAFEKCASLSSVDLNKSSITAISDRTFNGCTSLTSIAIPVRIKSIGSVAFDGCTQLGKLTLGDGEGTWIKTTDTTDKRMLNVSDATHNAKMLRSQDESGQWCSGGIKIDSSAVKYANVTCDTDSFTKVGISGVGCTTKIWDKDKYGRISITFTAPTKNIKGFIVCKNASGEELYKAEKTFDTTGQPIIFTITTEQFASLAPDETLTVSCESVLDITSDGLVSLKSGVSSFTSTDLIIIPEALNTITVTGVANNGFKGCRAGSIEFAAPENITEIGNSGFEDCLNMTTCPINQNFKNLTTLGNNAFYSPRFSSVSIPDSVISIGDRCFFDSEVSEHPLTEVIFGETSSLGWIGEGAFEYAQLTTFTVPQYVTHIGKYAFRNSSVSNIAFANRDGWKQIGSTVVVPIGEGDEGEKQNASNLKDCLESNNNWGFTGLEITEVTFDLTYVSTREAFTIIAPTGAYQFVPLIPGVKYTISMDVDEDEEVDCFQIMNKKWKGQSFNWNQNESTITEDDDWYYAQDSTGWYIYNEYIFAPEGIQKIVFTVNYQILALPYFYYFD